MVEKVPDFQAYRGEGQPCFAHEVELECAKLLDYYEIPWMYEPHTFVLEEGHLRVPDGPGLGVAPLPDVLARRTTDIELVRPA